MDPLPKVDLELPGDERVTACSAAQPGTVPGTQPIINKSVDVSYEQCSKSTNTLSTRAWPHPISRPAGPGGSWWGGATRLTGVMFGFSGWSCAGNRAEPGRLRSLTSAGLPPLMWLALGICVGRRPPVQGTGHCLRSRADDERQPLRWKDGGRTRKED